VILSWAQDDEQVLFHLSKDTLNTHPRTPDKVRKTTDPDNTILSIVLNHCIVQRIPKFVVAIVYHGKLRNTLRCIIIVSPIALDITALVF
jgi:hypothetical protein